MASDYKVLFTRSASSDLDGILAYISDTMNNPDAAASFFDELKKQITDICAFPFSSEAVNNDYITLKGIRKSLVGSYVLYYYPDTDNNTVTVLRIIYGKRDLDSIIRELNI